jgi:hypothetical protein
MLPPDGGNSITDLLPRRFFNFLMITSDKKPINEVILVSILYYDIEKINLDLTLMFLLSLLCFGDMLF